jgi:lysophospholipase L1-like esterase
MGRQKRKKLLWIALIIIVVIVVSIVFIVTGLFGKENKSENYTEENDSESYAKEYKYYTKEYKVVGLGDSYASGEGNPPYEDSLRHISKKSWQYQLKLNDNELNNNDFATLNVVSCTGAKTTNIYSKKQKIIVSRKGVKEDEDVSVPLQIDAVENDTDLVVMSIGGNDAQWTKLLESMLIPLKDINYDEADMDIANAINRLGKVVNKIHETAPKAKIILSNYPRLLEVEDFVGQGITKLGLTKEERSGLSTRVTNFNDKLELKFNDTSYVYIADVYSEFKDHAVGSKDPYLSDIEFTSKIPPVAAKKSMHPNEKGIEAYVVAFQKVLDRFKEDNEYKIWKGRHYSGH